jgi:hypothetical protein
MRRATRRAPPPPYAVRAQSAGQAANARHARLNIRRAASMISMHIAGGRIEDPAQLELFQEQPRTFR